MKKRVLSISYDQAILKTRQYILEQEGLEVVSASGFSDAIAQCKNGKFALVVLGHSLSPQDKTAFANELREHCACPILSIRRPGQSKHPDADYSVDAGEGPQAMVAVVREALGISN